METFLFALVGTAVAFAAMALGVLAGRPPLERGCGRADEAGGACRACTRPCPRREARDAGDAP